MLSFVIPCTVVCILSICEVDDVDDDELTTNIAGINGKCDKRRLITTDEASR